MISASADCRLRKDLFLDERGKDEACREFGMKRNESRVLLHRANKPLSLTLSGARLRSKGRMWPGGREHETFFGEKVTTYRMGFRVMNHHEATRQASRKSNFSASSPLRFENNSRKIFFCAECANDLQAGVALIEQSKAILSPDASNREPGALNWTG